MSLLELLITAKKCKHISVLEVFEIEELEMFMIKIQRCVMWAGATKLESLYLSTIHLQNQQSTTIFT
jgi:hypothetical protein